MITALDRAPELVKYELLERIGVGGMATVYRARDRRLGREVAVKLIHTHLRENTEVAARFVSEARAVARIRHPNVVEVFDVSDEQEPERYLVVELVRGTTLRALLSRHARLPPELSASIALEVAAGLAHAHLQGIVHRDVKPENVLLDTSAVGSGLAPAEPAADRVRVKLTDFGIAKLLDAQGVTSTGQVLGSPAHMAPEQIEGGDVGPRADVFALGVMLYECMVGRLPFDGKNPAQVLRRVLDGTYPPADREVPTVGARWAAVIARALHREPADRYDSVDAFAAAMRAELSVLPSAEPRREIDRFLGDEAGYLADHPDRIVKALVDGGERARAGSDFLLASAQFSRALAYKPGDADLLRRVSHLSRREQLRRLSRVALLVLAVAGVGVAAAAWLRTRARPPVVADATGAPGDPVKTGGAPVVGASPGADRAAQGPAPGTVPAQTRRPALREAPRRNGVTASPPSSRSAAMRKVVIDVIGPKGGYLKIDGARQDTWFGVQHELSVGPHTFEFVPANADCCRPSPPLTRNIDEGEGVESVLLTVGFRDAHLRVAVGPPGTLRCRSLFGGDLTVPGSRVVPMSRLSASGPCTLSPEDATSGPVTKEVTLTAGQTTEMSWP